MRGLLALGRQSRWLGFGFCLCAWPCRWRCGCIGLCCLGSPAVVLVGLALALGEPGTTWPRWIAGVELRLLGPLWAVVAGWCRADRKDECSGKFVDLHDYPRWFWVLFDVVIRIWLRQDKHPLRLAIRPLYLVRFQRLTEFCPKRCVGVRSSQSLPHPPNAPKHSQLT
jgi:hypothetical protein